jgi:Fur family peroxide stress response transcriptional regulator
VNHPERKTKRADLEAVCRRLGLPLTVQRQVILEALAERDDHPTADQIFEAVRDRLPSLSRTTVYRVLDTLVRVGLAAKTCHPGTSVRFDPRTNRHHHLICQLCERVIDLQSPALDALSMPKTRLEGFEISDYSIYFRGLCRECRSRQGDASPPNGHGSPASRRRRSPGVTTRRTKGAKG